MGALPAFVGVHIVAVGHIAGQIARLEGYHCRIIKGLHRLHQIVGGLPGAIHRNLPEGHFARPGYIKIAGFGAALSGRLPGADPGGPEPGLTAGLCVKEPEGDVHALDLLQMAVGGKSLVQQFFAGHMLFQCGNGGLFVQLEGDHSVGLQIVRQVAHHDHRCSAVRTVCGRSGFISDDFAVAAFAPVDLQAFLLLVQELLLFHLPRVILGSGLFLFQCLVMGLHGLHIKLGVAVGALHFLDGTVKLHLAAAAWALIFQNHAHRFTSRWNPSEIRWRRRR